MGNLYSTLGELGRITMSQVNYAQRPGLLEAIDLTRDWKSMAVSGALVVRTGERAGSCHSAVTRGF